MAQPRKTKERLLAEGTYRSDRHSAVGYIPENKSIPEMPNNLDDLTKVIWIDVISQLEETGYLCRADTYSMIALCELISELRNDPKQFTAAQYTQLRLYLCEFGMTPASRARMPSGKPIEAENPFTQLLNMSGGVDVKRLTS